MSDSPSRSGRGGRSLPLRLRLAPEDGGPAHERVLRKPFRLGFGEDCDIRLEGGHGPDVVFQVERARGPLLIAEALPPEEFDHYVELKIDGEPLRQPLKALRPGTLLDIVDKGTRRRYQLVVDPSQTQRWLRPRNLAAVIAVLVLVGAGFGAYLHHSLLSTRSEVTRTTERVEKTEAALARTSQELLDSVARMGSTDAELARTVRELGRLHGNTFQEIRREFTDAITQLDARSREAVAKVAREDVSRRGELAREARSQLDTLRGEFSTRMVESYQQLKALEQTLLDTMARRFAEREPALAGLKQVLAASREAVLFVRTTYQVRLGASGELRELTAMGTGFLVGEWGLAISAQHVLFPWRFDKELLVLAELELAEVVAESVRWSVWPAGSRVLSDAPDDDSFDEQAAFSSGAPHERGLRMLAAPEPQLTPILVPSPIGVVELPVPLPGAGDVAVFQIMSFDSPLPHLSLTSSTEVEALDEVLVLGYPYSRLKDGVGWPQGVRGFVRRAGDELVEIDAAVHPGLSGGPVLDDEGEVLGMVSAIIGSEVYGTAVRARHLRAALDDAREQVRKEEQRLSDLGCDPGTVDGVFDAATRDAYRCEARR